MPNFVACNTCLCCHPNAKVYVTTLFWRELSFWREVALAGQTHCLSVLEKTQQMSSLEQQSSMRKVNVMLSLCAYDERNSLASGLLSCAAPSAPAHAIYAPATPLHSTPLHLDAVKEPCDYFTCPAHLAVRFLVYPAVTYKQHTP